MAVQTAPKVGVAAPPRKRRNRLTPNLAMIRARARKGLGRGDLAAMTGLSEKQIGYLERGMVRDPWMSTCAAIADALEVDVLELFPGIERRYRR